MKGRNRMITWTIAVVLLMTTIPAFAEKTTPATDKNSAVPAVPRAIPDLIPVVSQIRPAHQHAVRHQQVDHFRRPAGSSGIPHELEIREALLPGWRHHRREEQFVLRAAMGAAGLQLFDLAGRDLLLSAPILQELGSQQYGRRQRDRRDPLRPTGLHAGAELPGAEPDRESRAATGGVGQPPHVRAFRLEHTTWAGLTTA